MSAVRTWADGFGRWYAEVPEYPVATAAQRARDVIRIELALRGDLPSSRYVVEVEPAPEYGPNVWREADQ